MFLKEFRDFAMRGNVLDMGVGIVIGAAFTSVINSLVNDLLTPPLGLLMGNVDFSNLFITLSGGPFDTLADAQEAGAVTLNYGLFLNALISFLIVAFVLFLLIRQVNKWGELLKDEDTDVAEEVKNKTCPFCLSVVDVKATRCKFCTSELEAA